MLELLIACHSPTYVHLAGADPAIDSAAIEIDSAAIESSDDDTATDEPADVDGDGYDATVDCDDADAEVHPDAEETCGNGRDDNCNGTVDECEPTRAIVLEGTELTTIDRKSLMGTSLAVCDANGDGVDDVVVGAPGYDNATGAVYVFYGPIDANRDAKDADYALMGPAWKTFTGASIDCRRDSDGDGVADIIVGAPGRSAMSRSPGIVYLVPGGGAGALPIADEAASAWVGSEATDRLGFQVVAIDADGDGTDEVAATVALNEAHEFQFGGAYLFDGAGTSGRHPDRPTAYVYGTHDDRVDVEVGNAGDLDGDGVEELVAAAANYDTRELLVFGGPLVGPISMFDAEHRIVGGGPNYVRWSGIGHADLDGDGGDDLFVGNSMENPDNSCDGAVYAFFASIGEDTNTEAAEMQIMGPVDECSGVGSDVTSAGDVDGDGAADLLIGAAYGTRVYLQYGGNRGVYQIEETAQAWWQATDAQSQAGASIAAGDVDGDGVVEFVIGSPRDGENTEGGITIVSGFEI